MIHCDWWRSSPVTVTPTETLSPLSNLRMWLTDRVAQSNKSRIGKARAAAFTMLKNVLTSRNICIATKLQSLEGIFGGIISGKVGKTSTNNHLLYKPFQDKSETVFLLRKNIQISYTCITNIFFTWLFSLLDNKF